MVKIKNLHPGILVVRLTSGHAMELQPDEVAVVEEDEILKSEKAMQLVEEKKLKLIRAGK